MPEPLVFPTPKVFHLKKKKKVRVLDPSKNKVTHQIGEKPQRDEEQPREFPLGKFNKDPLTG